MQGESNAPETQSFSLEEAASKCSVHASWTRESSWFINTTFNKCWFQRERHSLDDALRFHCCWHTVACAQFDSGRVLVDGGGVGIREINPTELRLPLTIMACSVGLAMSMRPDKFLAIAGVLHDPSELVAMDGNHRLAALARRRTQGQPDLLSEVVVYVCR
jgi:hypothetical protein